MTTTRTDLAPTAAPTARVGNLAIYKTAPARFVLTALDGEVVGTYPTARKASDAAVARIAAAYRRR